MTEDEAQLRERLETEQPLVAKVFPSATINPEESVVIIKGHHLPPGWSHEETDLSCMWNSASCEMYNDWPCADDPECDGGAVPACNADGRCGSE